MAPAASGGWGGGGGKRGFQEPRMERGRAWSPAQVGSGRWEGSETPTIRSSRSREVSIAQHEWGLGEGAGRWEAGLLSWPCARPGGRLHCPVSAGPGGPHHHPPVQGALLLLPQEPLVLQLRAGLCAQWPHLPLPRLPVDGWL